MALRIHTLAASAVLAMATFPAQSETWRIIPTLSVTETLTNNVNLGTSETARGDLVSEITPGVEFRGTGARALIEGRVAVPLLYYAKTSFNDENYLLANIHGRVEAIEKFFYVDGLISVTPDFLTPLGAQPVDLTSATPNRYTSYLYRVSPYIQGGNPEGVQYLLRNDSSWANLSGAPISTEDSYTSEWTGRLDTPVAPLGWHADFDLVSVKFNNQDPQRTNILRVGPRYAYTSQTRLTAIVGYEDNRYPFSDYAGFVYGVGIEWQPTERTQLVAGWEHRFFGSSYRFTFDHRTPLSVWQFRASRLISSYPQQLGTLAAGSNVPAVLDQLFVSRIPDPTQRQQVIDEFIQKRGIPTELSSPVNLYTQQITIDQNLSATMGLLGVRNSIFVTLYRYDTEPITGSGVILPPVIAFGNNNTQLGTNVVWTYNLTPLSTLSLNANAYRTTAPGTNDATNQGAARLAVTSRLSPNMSAFAGARYQWLRSGFPGVTDYAEAAAFAGLSYSFR